MDRQRNNEPRLWEALSLFLPSIIISILSRGREGALCSGLTGVRGSAGEGALDDDVLESEVDLERLPEDPPSLALS